MAATNKIINLIIKHSFVSACLGLLVLTLAVYWRTFGYGFIWDDFTYIVNSDVLASPTGLLRLWTTHSTADFWPLSYSLFWLQKQIYGNDQVGFHLVNLTLFFASGVLIYKLLKKINVKSAFFIAAIYLVHPMNVEASVWVFQAKTNLANIFGLLSLICWVSFVRNNRQYLSYGMAFVFLLLSFLAKISLVMIPILMFLFIHLYDNRRSFFKKMMVVLPFFICAFAIGLINLYWDSNSYVVPPSEMILEPSYLFRFALVGKTFLFYLTKTLWPWPLMFAHPRWQLDLDSFFTFLPSIILGAFLVYSGFEIVRKRKLSVLTIGILVSFLILFPALGVAEIYFMRFSFVAEHWLTLGMLGFLVAVLENVYSIRYFKYFVALMVLALGVISYEYSGEYSSEKNLLETSLEKNPVSILPHNLLGLIYKNEGNLEKAMDHFQKSIDIQPNAQSYFNKASIYESLNQFDTAKKNYLTAIELNPYIPKTYVNLAVLYVKMNDFQNAFDNFNKALARDPGDSTIYYNIGRTFELMNRKADAIEWVKKAVTLQPGNEIYLSAIQRLSK